jgi:hypothetical protein
MNPTATIVVEPKTHPGRLEWETEGYENNSSDRIESSGSLISGNRFLSFFAIQRSFFYCDQVDHDNTAEVP